ncbi:MAG TPA: uracil-DNA glycosylase family protein [Candidatus Hydrogenedentes bacterium]|nr:uracil-DNA glycosylase family protein [Candidatus Hydrogenedentota bacterium]HOL77241.1 uracil-DNA glycosylase family protein [Candidatus Hydrogenedentota bacterium]HPO86531.1 uracil-DNA glycosylase family protein [Candidatus Hydrogenedentota bacterium]
MVGLEPVSLDDLIQRVRACTICKSVLPLGPRPIFRVSETARILIVGQAPGLRVHQTGIPWNDPSGDRLRQWMGIDRETFYDVSRIAIIPTGLCYPGRNARGGDLPPRTECAEQWLPLLLKHLQKIDLKILAGTYAHRLYLGDRVCGSLTETVRSWRDYLPHYFVLPHPSFRNLRWLQNNPWFEKEVVPMLRCRIQEVLSLP